MCAGGDHRISEWNLASISCLFRYSKVYSSVCWPTPFPVCVRGSGMAEFCSRKSARKFKHKIFQEKVLCRVPSKMRKKISPCSSFVNSSVIQMRSWFSLHTVIYSSRKHHERSSEVAGFCSFINERLLSKTNTVASSNSLFVTHPHLPWLTVEKARGVERQGTKTPFRSPCQHSCHCTRPLTANPINSHIFRQCILQIILVWVDCFQKSHGSIGVTRILSRGRRQQWTNLIFVEFRD